MQYTVVVELFFGKPVRVLIMAGALNGFILPVALGLMLLAAYRKDIIGEYHHSKWLTALGVIVTAATLYLSVATILRMA